MNTEWHSKYSTLSDEAAARQFLDNALADAIEWLGNPRIPIRTVHLRLSRKLNPTEHIRQDFQLCELVSEQKGEFAIYTSRDSSDSLFHGQFAHEIAHLLDPLVYDLYIEGLNTLYAERVVNKYGLDWASWSIYFANDKESFYARTFHMMKSISNTIGFNRIANMLNFAENVSGSGKRRIAINRWLDTLDASQKRRVVDIIQDHWSSIHTTEHETVATSQPPTQAMLT